MVRAIEIESERDYELQKKGWVVLTVCRAEAAQMRRGEKGNTDSGGGGSSSSNGWWLISGIWHCHLIQPASLQQHWTPWTHWAKMAASLHCTQWTPQHSNIDTLAQTEDVTVRFRDGEYGERCVEEDGCVACNFSSMSLMKEPTLWYEFYILCMWFANNVIDIRSKSRTVFQKESPSKTCRTFHWVGRGIVI